MLQYSKAAAWQLHRWQELRGALLSDQSAFQSFSRPMPRSVASPHRRRSMCQHQPRR